MWIIYAHNHFLVTVCVDCIVSQVSHGIKYLFLPLTSKVIRMDSKIFFTSRPEHTGHVGSSDHGYSVFRRTLVGLCIVWFVGSASALAQTAPDLGATSPFAIVSETFVNTTAGTVVNGDVCFTTGPAVAPTINGTTATPCPPQTGIDQNDALADLNSQSCTSLGAAVALDTIAIGGGPPGVFPPGCYSSTGAMSITTGTTVTLDGIGVYIFRPGGALDPAADSNVVIAGGACANNIFWTPIGGTTVGANANFIGSIFRGTAAGLSITLGNSATLLGRALAFGSTVTTANNTITVPAACPGTLSVVKNSVGGDDAFEFTSSTLTPSPFTLTTAGGTATTTFTDLIPGTFDVAETVLAGWALTSQTCDNGNAPSAITLGAGDMVTCTFENTLLGAGQGSITVEKQTLPDGSTQSFSFSGDVVGSITDGNSLTVLVDPGTYTSTEALLAGWNLSSIVCDDANSTGDLGTATATFIVEADELVRCVFTNTQGAVVPPLIPPTAVPVLTRSGLVIMLLAMLLIVAYSWRHTKQN